MNALQTFMAACNRQTRGINQEPVTINGSTFYGTFGDPQLLPVQTRHGDQDHLVVPFLSPAYQYATPPESKQYLTRHAGNRPYFIQMVEAKDPVCFTFILTEREL